MKNISNTDGLGILQEEDLASLVAMPASMFARKQFVLSVLQRLAAHYNQKVLDLLCSFFRE